MKQLKALILASCLLLPASAAYADTSAVTNTQVSISAGPLLISAPSIVNPFSSITVDGSQQIRYADLGSFEVGDATGSGAGWKIMVSASPFTDEKGNHIDTGSLLLSSPNQINANGTTSPIPNVIAGSYSIDDGGSYKLVSALANTGMGKYAVSFPANALRLTVPASVKVDATDSNSAYQSTITWSVQSTP